MIPYYELYESGLLGEEIAARYLFDLSLESINGFSRMMQKLCPPFQKARQICFQLHRTSLQRFQQRILPTQ